MANIPGYRLPLAGTQPEYLHPAYRSSIKRAPTRPLILAPHTLSEVTGPVFGDDTVHPGDGDLTRQHGGEPLGERIFVSGRVLDENSRPVRNALIEIWQANAAGRYRHKSDTHNAPLDPNFTGYGRVMTDDLGRYQFTTVKPGAYPWGNHYNAWRPQHIHLSLFGAGILERLVTQMYFPGDPLLDDDPIYNSVADEKARRRLIARFDWETTVPMEGLGYSFDVVLRGREVTPFERGER
ncbi:MAG TPA: protocatechuate 3,4-dioxygenase subunit beta [Ktedonobacterales bacterium]|nr:protocatechuate 3,4-dioxygenase subunit beta [Ktedonobacterales bacterium]